MRKVLSNLFYNSAYQILLVLLPLITTPYVSRVLGAENIGTYAYYFTYASYFVMASKLGVANYGNRSIASVLDDKKQMNIVFSEIYSIQFIASCISIIVYFLLCFSQKNLQIYLCAGLYAFSGALDISWLYFGLEEFKKTAIRSTFVKVLSVALIFFIVKTRDDLAPYTIICCGTHFATNVLLWLMLPMIGVKPRLMFGKECLIHIKPLLILFLPVIGVSLYNYMDKLMLGSMVEIEELGFYQSSEAIMSVPTSLIAALGTVMLPRMTYLYSKGQEKNALKYIFNSMWLAVFVVSAFAFGIIGVAPEFVSLFYGPGYGRCVILLRILMNATIFVAMANVVRTQVLIPKSLDKIYIISIFSGAAINLFLNWLLIPVYGAAGASIATVIAEFTVFIIQTLICDKYAPIIKYIIQSLPFIFIGGIMAYILINISLPITNVLGLLLKILIGATIYLLFSALYYALFLRKMNLTNEENNRFEKDEM